ncbi:DNA repair protein RecO [Taibaiella sp. KBW10]|uniref:DNA repair protein RecO n=1 Tax=Taibaiella sp. KBW10 TaxID=2153357 RepID=UPI000F5AAE8C|nr:DNA repair protein RecO [Taibaiella sp. KBW10]RQO32197.1 DNA repair protein RecO [Taibaiella sp. KBW10]
MISSTSGIVLRTIKYGETSVICSIFTEVYGLQSYLVKGVRTDKKQSKKGNILRPGNILDLQVYHQPAKNLQYLKEFQLACFYKHIGEDIIKNSILLFCVEVLSNFLITEDEQCDLYDFAIDFLHYLDAADPKKIANLPLYFVIQTAQIMGYGIQNNYSSSHCYLNTYEGRFEMAMGNALPIFDKELSLAASQCLVPHSTDTFAALSLPALDRRYLLEGYLHFLQIHDNNFKPLKSLEVLQAILH